MHEPITVDVNDAGTVANITIPIDGNGTDAVSNASLAQLRDEIVPDTVGALPNAEAGVTGHDRPVEGRHRRDQVEAAARRRVRARVRLPPDAGRLPLARDRGQGDRAEPALGRRRLRRAGARLPARHRQGLLGFSSTAGDRPGRAAAPVRDPVRALDGLPRVPPEPDPRAVPAGRLHGRGGHAGDQVDRGRRHERRDRHGRRVRDLHHALDADLQAVRRRACGGDPDRRDDRPRRAAAGLDEAARRLELVPAELARVASPAGRLRARGLAPAAKPTPVSA